MMETRVQQVLNIMEAQPQNFSMQLHSCQIISNMAREEATNAYFMEQNAHGLILNALERFGHSKWKLAWLGCSAIWNLARPAMHREQFSEETIDFLISLLKRHQQLPKVCHTIMGSLSNLALVPALKKQIERHIKLLIFISRQFAYSDEIASTSAGLLANLAFEDDTPETLVENNVISVIAEMWNGRSRDETFLRNTIALLCNCATASNFKLKLLASDLIEHLYRLRVLVSEPSTINLLENIFHTLGIRCASLVGPFAAWTGLYNNTVLKELHGTFEIRALTVVSAEIIATFVFVFVIFRVAVSKNHEGNPCVGLIIGVALFIGCSMAGKFSGGALNPAVALGVMISRRLKGDPLGNIGLHFGAYWFGTIIGGILALMMHAIMNMFENGEEKVVKEDVQEEADEEPVI